MIVSVSKGLQITIPSLIREELGLIVGSKVDINVKNKEIILKPIGDDLEKVFKETEHIKPKHKLTAKQMDEINEKMFR
ncbi:AbrB/MazE/SpoVT family DNA-binding domain-containing protein [Candidatus Woesearchaeota archaeon]|nr:AbrB/MazE/SpoVT family DNA-binding domain-containing protein [Candidatus Woesearchaeota archaeon]